MIWKVLLCDPLLSLSRLSSGGCQYWEQGASSWVHFHQPLAFWPLAWTCPFLTPGPFYRPPRKSQTLFLHSAHLESAHAVQGLGVWILHFQNSQGCETIQLINTNRSPCQRSPGRGAKVGPRCRVRWPGTSSFGGGVYRVSAFPTQAKEVRAGRRVERVEKRDGGRVRRGELKH